MPHLRTRYLEPILKNTLSASPIVGVVGQRQTGKTTLLEKISSDYVTLDNPEDLENALKNPKLLISDRKAPFGIDECQESPPLFPILKEWVRVHKNPGQFILSGSVRFSSIEEIRESLTGRMIDIELLPFCVTEAHGLPLFNIKRLTTSKNPLERLSENPLASPKKVHLFEDYLKKGGLPGICFIRSNSIRIRKLRSHIKTILDRDLRQVTSTLLDYLTLKTFLEEVALQQGEVFDLAKACRGARISPNSGKKLLSGLESVFLIRSIRKEGDTQGRLVYLEDQGMATFLLQERGIVLRKAQQFRASDWNRFLFPQLFAQLNYQNGSAFEFFSYRTRGGALIDFVVQLDGHYQGYSIGFAEKATHHQMRSAESFLKKQKNAKVILLHMGSSFRKISDQIFEAPLGSVV